MTIKNMTKQNAIDTVQSILEIEKLREVAKEIGVTFSGNTGVESLKAKIMKSLNAWEDDIESDNEDNINAVLNEGSDEEIQIAKVPEKSNEQSLDEMLKMDPTKIRDITTRRKIVRAQALRLIRCSIVNLDQNDRELEGAIITIYNKYTGKVSKYVPFGEGSENGYHLPYIIVEHLKNAKYVMRRPVKGKNGQKRYTTTLQAKYMVTELEPLSKKELADMAARQAASQAIT